MIPQVYRDVDILGCLERIVNQHTKEFKLHYIFQTANSLPSLMNHSTTQSTN